MNRMMSFKNKVKKKHIFNFSKYKELKEIRNLNESGHKFCKNHYFLLKI